MAVDATTSPRAALMAAGSRGASHANYGDNIEHNAKLRAMVIGLPAGAPESDTYQEHGRRGNEGLGV